MHLSPSASPLLLPPEGSEGSDWTLLTIPPDHEDTKLSGKYEKCPLHLASDLEGCETNIHPTYKKTPSSRPRLGSYTLLPCVLLSGHCRCCPPPGSLLPPALGTLVFLRVLSLMNCKISSLRGKIYDPSLKMSCTKWAVDIYFSFPPSTYKGQ